MQCADGHKNWRVAQKENGICTSPNPRSLVIENIEYLGDGLVILRGKIVKSL